MSSASNEFGKDFGLIHEAVITGRKVGWDADIWAKLAHGGEDMMRSFLSVINGTGVVEIIRKLTTPTVFYLPAIKKPKRLKDCKNVWMSEVAKELFETVSALGAQKRREATHCNIFDAALDDFELIADLGGEVVAVRASVEELEVTISQMIAKQVDGNSSIFLLGSPVVNVFYVRDPNNSARVLCVRVHCVHYISGGSKWFVRSYEARRDPMDLWNDGTRVFPATVAA